MNLNEYQELAHETANLSLKEDVGALLSNYAMGLAGESGEVIDLLKKEIYHGHPHDREKLKKELGDVLWYLAMIANVNGIPLSEVASANVAKLKARYPNGFDARRSQNRSAE